MKTAFVTGATGLLGNNLVRSLAGRGIRVKALVRDREKARRQFAGVPVEVVVGDMTDVGGFAPALAETDVLFHTAAYFRDSYTGGSHWKDLYRINVEGTDELLAAAYRAGIRRMIHTSSIAVLGDNPGGFVDETMLRNEADADDYYRSKILCDRRIDAFLERVPDMSVTLILPGWMHGPGDIGPTSAGQVVLDFMAGRLLGVVEAGFSFVDARDVAEAMVAAVAKGRRGERYLAAGHPLSMGDLLVRLERVTGKKAPRRRLPFPLLWTVAVGQELYARITGKPVLLSLATVRNLRTDRHRRFSHDKSERELGVTFRPIEETLADVVAWYRQNGWVPAGGSHPTGKVQTV